MPTHLLPIGQQVSCSVRRAGAPPSQDRSPKVLCAPAKPAALLVRGTSLRIADLRSQPAYISVVVGRSTMPRRVVPTQPPGHHQARSTPRARQPASRRPALPAPLPPAQNHAIYQAKRSLDKPFHISTTAALGC